jgi:hypothetical protein
MRAQWYPPAVSGASGAVGPVFAGRSAMSAIAFKVNRKNGDYIRMTVVPMNHSEEPHFGLLDSAIVAFFLACASGLIYVLVLN